MEWRAKRSWSHFTVFFLITIGLSFWLSRHLSIELSLGVWFTVVTLGLFGAYVTKQRASDARDAVRGITRRDPETMLSVDALAPAAHPFRARLARAAAVPIATVSARTMTLVVGLAFVASGTLLPMTLKLPHWIELELVLAVWWGTLTGLLAVLLFRGTRVHEDHAFRVRWNLPEIGAKKAPSESDSSSPNDSKGSWLGRLDFPDAGCTDIEGCAGVLVGLLLAAVAVAAAWLVVELLFPLVFFFLYWLVAKALSRVANDRHGCERNLGRAIVWGASWATLYTLPLGVVVWAVHLLLAAKHAL